MSLAESWRQNWVGILSVFKDHYLRLIQVLRTKNCWLLASSWPIFWYLSIQKTSLDLSGNQGEIHHRVLAKCINMYFKNIFLWDLSYYWNATSDFHCSWIPFQNSQWWKHKSSLACFAWHTFVICNMTLRQPFKIIIEDCDTKGVLWISSDRRKNHWIPGTVTPQILEPYKFSKRIVLYLQNYESVICRHHPQFSDCFEYPKNPY